MLKKTLVIGMGMSVSPLILLFSTPWLARAYSPQEFGSLAIFMAAISVLASVSCLRHDAAILVVHDSKVSSTIQLALIYAFIFSIFSSMAFSFFAPVVLGAKYDLFNENRFLYTLGVVGASLVLLACAFSMRRGNYALNAIIRAIQGPAYVTLAIFLSTGLVDAWAYGLGLAGLLSLIYCLFNSRLSSPASIWKQACDLKDYSLILTPTYLLDSLALVLPIFFINTIYTAAEVGNYSQINRLIGGGLLLVSAVIGQILFDQSGKLYRKGDSSYSIFMAAMYVLIAIAGLMLVTIIFFGSDLVQIILGDGWRSDTLFLLVISIPIFCKFIVSPISCIFLSHEQKKYVSYWQTLYFSVTFISLSILTLLKVSIETFLIGYAIGEIVLYSLYYYWAKKIAKSVGN